MQYINPQWEALLQHNHLASFDALWDLKADWFEAPNERRGGFSGVCRLELPSPTGECVTVFLKRQANHRCKSWRHPFRGIATFRREFNNCQRFEKNQLPTLTPIYFAERWRQGKCEAILMTLALTAYQSLEALTNQWQAEGWPCLSLRQQVIQQVADVVRRMHSVRFRHGCLYPKHIFVRLPKTDNEQVAVKLIDLEKARRWPSIKSCQVRDLAALNRHTENCQVKDRLRFLKSYLKTPTVNQQARQYLQKFAKRDAKKHLWDVKP